MTATLVIRDARPREVFCVTCGATPGTGCLTTNGYRTGFHPARKEWASQHNVEVPIGAR